MNQFDPNSIYQGRITNQVLTETKNKDPQFRVSVELTHKLKGKTEAEGIESLPESLCQTKVIYFSFNTEPKFLERTFRDLKNLGLTGPNIEVLDPDHPKALRLEGKRVCLKPRYTPSNDGGPDKDWWNMVFPAERAPKISSEAIAQFKNLNASALTTCFAKAGEPQTERLPI